VNRGVDLVGEKVGQVGSGNSSHVNDVAQKTSLAGEVGQKVENVEIKHNTCRNFLLPTHHTNMAKKCSKY
jgi:hypothetical protein